MNQKAYVYKPDGSVSAYIPKGETFDIRELQALVGGYIELVDVHEDFYAVCNEEGKQIGLEPNPKATNLAQTKGHFPPDDYFVGTIVFVQKSLIQ